MDEDDIVYGTGEVNTVRAGCFTALILTGAYLLMFRILAQSALMCQIDP